MKRSGVPWLFVALLVLVVLVSAGVYWLNTWANPYWNAEQSRLRIERTLDPDVLQSWATNLLQKYSYETNFGPCYIVDAPLPSGLGNIWMHERPDIVLRDGRNDSGRYVCLSWGSAMLGRWGLAIGPPKFVLQDGMESGGPPDWPPKPWKPGVYFFQHYH